MLLSIIVPVYNMASDEKLNHCLDSLISQTITDYEIIAVDDASTDESLSILHSYQTKFKGKFTVIHYDQNKRQGGAKNEGLNVATGEFVSFIDSDDWVTKDYYEKLINKARETGADMVGCDYSFVNEYTFTPGKKVVTNTEDQTGILDDEKHKKLIMRSGSMVIKIYKREVLTANNLNFPSGIFYEDNCAGPLWSVYFKHFERVEEPLYFYYQHDTSTVHTISKERCEDRLKALEILYDECKNRKIDNNEITILEKYFDALEYRFTELYLINTLFSYAQGVKHMDISFVSKMKRGILERFPKFRENKHYQALTNADEKKFIDMLMTNSAYFCMMYSLKSFYRNMKKDDKIKD